MVSRFFISIFTFLFITQGLSTLNRIDLSENFRSRRSRWGSLGFAVDGEWIEPTIPSTGTSTGGLVGSLLGRGA